MTKLARIAHWTPPISVFRVRRFAVALTIAVLCLVFVPWAEASNEPSLEAFWASFFRRPLGEAPAPTGNPLTARKVALGKRLFRDPRLSGDGRRSCASCHQPERAFTDGLPRARGRAGEALRRNTPTLFNLAWSDRFYWDGSEPTLESQAAVPITRVEEMAGRFPAIIGRLRKDPVLVGQFEDIYPPPSLTRETILKSLAAYERSLVSPRTRFDRWIEGDGDALTQAEIAGFRLFVGKAGCVSCHGGWRFTDDAFHDIGLAGGDPGRAAVAGGTPGIPAFKTPGLRELTRTAPFMHDGSIPTLEGVIDHYAGAFVRRPTLSNNMLRELKLTLSEKAVLVAFLKTLSSEPGTPR